MACREEANQTLSHEPASPSSSSSRQKLASSSTTPANKLTNCAAPHPSRRAVPAATSLPLRTHSTSTSCRPSTGRYKPLAAPKQTRSLSTKASAASRHLGGKDDQKDNDSTVDAPTKASTENHGVLLAEAIEVGREGPSRFYEHNLWAMVLGASREDEDG